MSHAPVPHKSVMLHEVLEALSPQDGEVYVDATFGAGGYSRAILGAAKCQVFAIDRDPHTVTLADALAREFAPGRFFFLAGTFSDMVTLLAAQGVTSVDGVVMDIGVSSMQIDEGARGFSFRADGPLDMRMSCEGRSAADLVNMCDEAELADILYQYGEERASRRIAKAIVRARSQAPITRTAQLVEIVRGAIGQKPGAMDSATRTFQALRIAVNDELGELKKALAAAEKILRPGGRLVVVVFHSLEDRIVKQFLLERSHGDSGVGASRHLPASLAGGVKRSPATFSMPKRRPIPPSDIETAENPRARSAKLRLATRTENAAQEKPHASQTQ